MLKLDESDEIPMGLCSSSVGLISAVLLSLMPHMDGHSIEICPGI